MSESAKEWLAQRVYFEGWKPYEHKVQHMEYAVSLDNALKYGEMRVDEELEKITSIEAAIEDIERCSKEALEPYYESSAKEIDEILDLRTIINGLKKERYVLKEQAEHLEQDVENNAYRKKALEWCCHGFRLQPGGLPKQCSVCFRLSSDAPYCHEVINEVDSCLKY